MFRWLRELQRYKAAWLKLYYRLKELEEIDSFHTLYYGDKQISVKEILKWMDTFMEGDK